MLPYQNFRKERFLTLEAPPCIRLIPIALVATVFLFGFSESLHAESPALPQGLEEDTPSSDGNKQESNQGPALPKGLDESSNEKSAPAETTESSVPAGLSQEPEDKIESESSDAPGLPSGLTDEPDAESEPVAPEEEKAAPAGFLKQIWEKHLRGFWETRGGGRTRSDPEQKTESLGEMRLQLEGNYHASEVSFRGRTDFLYDPVLDRHSIDLNTGEGWMDLREASVRFSPLPFMDVKAGRQTLTWGTGDFVFLNDLFPKDYRSFFIGRDVEYLKAPSDAIKLSLYSDAANVDIVYTPQFDHDRFVRGWRLSQFRNGEFRGRDDIVDVEEPDEWFTDDEIAVRVSNTVGSTELAAYGYTGFWKSPAGQDQQGRAIFPELNVYGASVRGTLREGIANAEVAYYDSKEDNDGDDPRIRNDEARALIGYTRQLPQIADDLSIGGQYYVKWMQDYSNYTAALPPNQPERDEFRHELTCRINKEFWRQTLTASLFSFYSPSANDGYLRPRISYDVTNNWTVSAGGNVFFSQDNDTFYGQFKKNSNIYASARYSF